MSKPATKQMPNPTDPIRCLACAAEIEHTFKQHGDYIALWCEDHKQWCGDHTRTDLKESLAQAYRQIMYYKEIERFLQEQRKNLAKQIETPLITFGID
jgi:hypothetical protein